MSRVRVNPAGYLKRSARLDVNWSFLRGEDDNSSLPSDADILDPALEFESSPMRVVAISTGTSGGAPKSALKSSFSPFCQVVFGPSAAFWEGTPARPTTTPCRTARDASTRRPGE